MKTSSQETDRRGTLELKEHRLISATPVMDMTSVLIQVCPQHYVMNPGDSKTWCGQLCRPTSNSSASRNVVYVSLKHEFHKEFPWRLFLVLRVVRCNTLIQVVWEATRLLFLYPHHQQQNQSQWIRHRDQRSQWPMMMLMQQLRETLTVPPLKCYFLTFLAWQ